MAQLDMEKFKAGRAALLAFARQHPGALTAHFLAQVLARVRGAAGRVTETKQLRDVSVMDWIQGGHSSLTELRDVREATTLASILDGVNREEIAAALDILTMRLHALMAAKSKGGSWDKASKFELIPTSGGDLLPAGLSGVAS